MQPGGAPAGPGQPVLFRTHANFWPQAAGRARSHLVRTTVRLRRHVWPRGPEQGRQGLDEKNMDEPGDDLGGEGVHNGGARPRQKTVGTG